jgi:hypothetical protein
MAALQAVTRPPHADATHAARQHRRVRIAEMPDLDLPALQAGEQGR